MPVKNSSLCNFGWKPENFNLISVDEQYYNLNSILGTNGLVVALTLLYIIFGAILLLNTLQDSGAIGTIRK